MKQYITQLRSARAGRKYEHLAIKAGISKSSMESIMNCRMTNPTLATFEAIVDSVGLEIKLVVKK